jgi:uncharacterized membrane protein
MTSKQPVTGHTRTFVITVDKIILGFTRHWLAVISLILALYVGLAMLAPALMAAGFTGPANSLYRFYGPFCHQMAFRSFFIFGDQYAYPRELAGTNLVPFETYAATLPEFAAIDPSDTNRLFLQARAFVGNMTMGYKSALCQRDLAIYGMMLIGGLIYGVVRRFRPVRQLPIWLFVLIGLFPIAWDGFSQLFGYFFALIPGAEGLAALFPPRESTPFLRVFTGALLGFALVWLIYPHLEDGLGRTGAELEEKLTRAGEL